MPSNDIKGAIITGDASYNYLRLKNGRLMARSRKEALMRSWPFTHLTESIAIINAVKADDSSTPQAT